MNINWYPGHMAKTKRMITEAIKDIDIVVEMVDARIPLASKNPDIEKLSGGKPKLLILNKSDLASPAENKKWSDYFEAEGYSVILNNSLKMNTTGFYNAIKSLYKEKAEKNALRGIKNKAIRIMILGIPNVGKSTFINSLSGEKRAKTEDRPGVTRGKQWITLKDGIALLDTPGILWPKLENQHAAANLAITGAINDNILDIEEIAVKLLKFLSVEHKQELISKYKLDSELPDDLYKLLKQIGKKRGYLISGGEIDTERTAIAVTDEFRAGKIGKISLEKAEIMNPKKSPDENGTEK